VITNSEASWGAGILISGMLIAVTMVTGAFFSRPVGTKLGLAIVVISFIACVLLPFGSIPVWGSAVGVLFSLIGLFFFVASLGGEK
jgi:hypothetical protein